MRNQRIVYHQDMKKYDKIIYLLTVKMTTYVIASKANQPYLAECQMLGENLMENSPDICIKCVIKDNSEWDEFVDSVCRTYGFTKKTCPIVYTLEGNLIGDGKDFVLYAKERYGRSVQIEKDSLKARVALNEEQNFDRMKKLREGETLGEKI